MYNSKTTFVTVNRFNFSSILLNASNSKTTFVTVNRLTGDTIINTINGFKNNLCYC